MKQRALQVVFVATFLIVAGVIIHHGKPKLLPPVQAQDYDYPSHHDLHPAPPQEAKAAIRSVQAQLTAFKKQDFQTAALYQSQDLESQFHSPQVFQSMMQQQYPAFLHYQYATYSIAGTPDQGRHVFVPVTLHMAHGLQVRAIYIMVREPQGYRVQGVGGGMDAMPMLPPMPEPMP